MIPRAGGFRVYAQRAYGEGVGFAVGWVDWLCTWLLLPSVDHRGGFLGAALAAGTSTREQLPSRFPRCSRASTGWACGGQFADGDHQQRVGLLFAILIAGCFLD